MVQILSARKGIVSALRMRYSYCSAFLSDEEEKMVAPTGFEPATSALRGRRPKPLDDGATISAALNVDTCGDAFCDAHL